MLEERLADLTAAIDRLTAALQTVQPAPAPTPAPAPAPTPAPATEPESELELEPEPTPEPEPEPEPTPEPEPKPEPKPRGRPKKAKPVREVTRMDVRAALVRLAELTSQAEAKAVLQSVGQANTISDLDPELYAEVADAANAMSDKLEDL